MRVTMLAFPGLSAPDPHTHTPLRTQRTSAQAYVTRLTCVLHESGAFTPAPGRPCGCPPTGSPPGTACLMSHVLVDALAAGVSSWLASPGPWPCLGKNQGGRSRGRTPPTLALVRLSVSCVTLTSALPRARPPFLHLHHQGDLGLPEKASYFTDSKSESGSEIRVRSPPSGVSEFNWHCFLMALKIVVRGTLASSRDPRP